MIDSLKDIIILNHRQFIALNKPATLPSVPNQTEDESLLDLAERYCRKKLYPVHRVDRPVSGIQLFAKSQKAHSKFAEMQRNKQWTKQYLALVKNKPLDDTATLKHYIQRDGKRHKAVILNDEKKAKLAVSKYKYLFSLEYYHVLEMELMTGRFHQIRCQLSAIGSPIKGDVKYGARRKNPDRSINLHSWKMKFTIGHDRKIIDLCAPLPEDSIWKAVNDGLQST